MKQSLQTFLVLFLTILLSSLIPATQVDASPCRGLESPVASPSACCQTMASLMTDAAEHVKTVPAEHGCPQAGWCQLKSGPEMFVRAHSGSQHLDYTGQYLAVAIQQPLPSPKKYARPQRISLIHSGTQRYILLCSFLI